MASVAEAPYTTDRLPFLQRPQVKCRTMHFEVKRTAEEESTVLTCLTDLGQIGTVPVQNRLAPFQEGYLQLEIVQDLDKRFFQSRDFQAVLDPTDKTYRVDFCTDVFEQSTDKCYKTLAQLVGNAYTETHSAAFRRT